MQMSAENFPKCSVAPAQFVAIRVDRPWKCLQPALRQCNAEQFLRTAKAKNTRPVSVFLISTLEVGLDSERKAILLTQWLTWMCCVSLPFS
jgi:hypothetical protein